MRFYRAILKNSRNEKPPFMIEICANFKKTFLKRKNFHEIILVVSLTPGL